jgi:hypothetical protein
MLVPLIGQEMFYVRSWVNVPQIFCSMQKGRTLNGTARPRREILNNAIPDDTWNGLRLKKKNTIKCNSSHGFTITVRTFGS